MPTGGYRAVPAVTRRMQGFSLPQTLLALLLLALIASGLANWQSALAQGLRAQSQTLQQWRLLEQQSDISPLPQADGLIIRNETSQGDCVSITVTLTGQRGTLLRLHCPQK